MVSREGSVDVAGQLLACSSGSANAALVCASDQSLVVTLKRQRAQRVPIAQWLDAAARSFHAFWVIAAGDVYFYELHSRGRRAGKPYTAITSTAV